jgi:tetratricopeptide (TPR) repeat protein
MRTALLAALLAGFANGQEPAVERLFAGAVEAQQGGDFALAVTNYQQIVKLQPEFFGAWANLGVALVRLGRFDEAIAAYRSALKLDPANKPVRMNLALAFYKKGDPRQAAAEFDALLKADPGNAQAATLMGDCYLQLGDHQRAIAVVAPAAEAHPEDLDAAYVLGSALIAAGKERDGLALVERVATQKNSADAYALAGKTWLKLGDPDRAIPHLEQAVRLNPGLPGIYTLRGVAREGTFNNDGAEADLRKGLDLNANDLEALVHLGAILYTRRDLSAAKSYLDRALKIDPSSLFALYEMALWKSASGQLDGAVGDLETVVRRDPGWMQAHVQLAALYYRLNRPQDGLKERQIVDRLSAEQQKAEANAGRGR